MAPQGQRASLIATVVAVVVVVVVFVPMITWYTGRGLYDGGKETRSLVEHGLWWVHKAGFGGWKLPLAAVASAPVLTAIAELAPVRAGPRAAVAVFAAVLGWGWVIAAGAGVGEDITRSWIRMPGPLASVALLATVYAGLRVAVWRARRAQ